MRNNLSYAKIYKLLIQKEKDNQEINLNEFSDKSGLKKSSLKVYIRNKLKGVFLIPKESEIYAVSSEIRNYSEESFLIYMSQKDIKENQKITLSERLMKLSIESFLAAIEIHNKPLIEYRYQTVTILIINAWELILKSYISKYHPEIRIIRDDGSSKEFKECVSCVVSQVGKDLFTLEENLLRLYEYRCKFIHFDGISIDALLFSLIQKSVILYSHFLEKYFNYDLSSSAPFFTLPVSFKKPVSPIDYLTNKSMTEDSPQIVKDFIFGFEESIKRLAEKQIDDLFFIPYSIAYKSEKRIKNADIVAAINNDKNVIISIKTETSFTTNPEAKGIRLEEEILYNDLFPMTYQDVCEYCYANFSDFKLNRDFHQQMKELKKDANIHRVRLLDPRNPKSSKKDYYSEEIKKKLNSIYTLKDGES